MTRRAGFACLSWIGVAMLASNGVAATPSDAPVDSVNVFIGTAGHGHTYPGATVPFGSVQLSPDTRRQGWDGSSGYHDSDATLLGFSHTHLSGTGVGDLGDILLLPVTGDLQPGGAYRPLDTAALASGFSHAGEAASPGDYRVTLDRYHIGVELTATAHCGLHRYTFPADQPGHVVFDLAHGISNHATAAGIKVDGDHRLVGSRTTDGWADHRTTYFVIESSRPWSGVALEKDNAAIGGDAATGTKIRGALDFKPDAAPLVLRVGLSAVSVDAAQKNLDAEARKLGFDEVRTAARQLWNEHLSRLTIDTPDPAIRRTFYTALYHTMLAPTLYNDADGGYRGHDGKVHARDGFANYSTFSFWDTFRAEHPLLTIVEPERVNDFVHSALAFYEQSDDHALPKWPLANFETHCMVGYHSVPVIYDAFAKGFRGFDAELALKAMTDTALHSHDCPDDYDARGYAVSDSGARTQGAARTLEYAYDDWCIAKMAKAIGKDGVAGQFEARSKYFGNLFDANLGFFRGRTTAGGWREPLDPKAVDFDDYTEANAWQYAFFVPQDPDALIKLYGGPAAFTAKLDASFDSDSDLHNALVDVSGLIGQYSHGNEPCHNYAYLYALAGAQDKTAKRVRQIMRMQYDDTPAGLCGNDDCGQMSAWYVWSAAGLYPANPADGRYVIGSPLVRSATFKLDPAFATGGTFTVKAPNATSQNLYVQSAKLNGKPLDRCWITHDEMTHGGTLELEMGMFPNRTWSGALAADTLDRSAFHITVDCSKSPDLQPFADRVQKVADTWYAREIDLLRPEHPSAATDVQFIVDENYDGVAATTDSTIRLSAKYFRTHPDDLGAIVHELAHVVQAYPSGAPWWMTEGFADYVRWYIYEPASARPRPDPATAKYDAGYRTSAAFLNWVAGRYGQAAVLRANDDCHHGVYKDENWIAYTGDSIEKLGEAWSVSLQKKKR